MSEDIKCDGCGLFKKQWVKTCINCELIAAGEKIKKLEAIANELADFYGDRNTWFEGDSDNYKPTGDCLKIKEYDSESYGIIAKGVNFKVGGKLARQKKQELNELRGKCSN